MSYRFVARQLGLLLIVLSTTMLGVWGWGVLSDEALTFAGSWSLLLSELGASGIGLALGGLLLWLGRGSGDDYLGRREALLLVGLSWFIGAGIAALPYWFWAISTADPGHPFRTYVGCYFEAMSGLTTTGATVLGSEGASIEELPPSLLLWRSLTHWIGGLGIVVLFVAVLPTLGVGGKRLFHAEMPGPQQQGVRPRIRETARALWIIYVVMTLAAAGSLRATGQMNWFDAFCHSMSMVSTGGLSTRDASIGYYNSVAVDAICIAFMLMAGVNFALYFHASRRRWDLLLRDTELRVYLLLKVGVILLVWLNIHGRPITTTTGDTFEAGVGEALQYAGFQTVALHTGTGYGTADYDLWPFLSKALLVGLMFIGGCAGSTAGGIKVIRFWIALKALTSELERLFRPNVVRPLKVGKTVVDDEIVRGSVVFFLTFLLTFTMGGTLVMLLEGEGGRCDFATAMSASLSTLANVGPGLGGVGATQNYGWFTGPSLIVLSILMALGRLEIFTVLILLSPRFWRNE